MMPSLNKSLYVIWSWYEVLFQENAIYMSEALVPTLINTFLILAPISCFCGVIVFISTPKTVEMMAFNAGNKNEIGVMNGKIGEGINGLVVLGERG